MNSQKNIRNGESNQEQNLDKDLEKLSPLNINKPAEGKDGVQSVGQKSNVGILKEICPSIRDYISGYIGLADAKAGVLIAILSALLSFEISKHEEMFRIVVGQWRGIEYLSLMCSAFLSGAIVCALLVVWPRTLISNRRGLVSWVHIAGYNKVDDYLKDFLLADEEQIISQICELNFNLSLICKRKYFWLSWAFKIGGFGVIALLIGLFL